MRTASGRPSRRQPSTGGTAAGGPHSGELVGLFVIRRDPMLDEKTIVEHCRTRLTGYKRPHRIEFCAALPRNPLGKVLRRALREAGPAPGQAQ